MSDNFDFVDEVGWAGRAFDVARALKLSVGACVAVALVVFVGVWLVQYSPTNQPAAASEPVPASPSLAQSPRYEPPRQQVQRRRGGAADCRGWENEIGGRNCARAPQRPALPIPPPPIPVLPPVDIEPRLIYGVQPSYPRRAEERGREGFVQIEFTVGVDGRVRDMVVIASHPQGLFDRAALDALEQRRYAPRLLDGRPVDSRRMRVVFEFRF